MKSDPYLERLPPQNIEAEQSVLGAVMIEQGALLKAIEVVIPEDFYRESHRKIFRSMLELFDKGEAIDLVTLTEQLERKNELDNAGGASYLAMLAGQTPTAANVWYHSKIVKEKAIVRALLKSSTEIAEKAYEDTLDPDELLDYAEKSVFEISDKRVKSALVALKDAVKDAMQTIAGLYEKKEAITGVPSGFKDLDELTSGFQRGDLIIVGGRPSMGKTALGLNIAQHVGIEMREPVAVFSLEMATRQIVLRMLCSEAAVDSNKVRRGFINRTDEWNRLTAAAGRLSESSIFIDDTATMGVLEIRAKARRLKMERGLGLVLVDYLQLMRGRGSFERREQEISDISRSLKALAKELDVPVIALSQLNRGVETRPNKRPTLADLRESGAIEQDADVIIFLYRDEVYDKSKNRGVAELHVAKQRNGPTDTIKLTFMGQNTAFRDYTEDYYPAEEEAEPF